MRTIAIVIVAGFLLSACGDSGTPPTGNGGTATATVSPEPSPPTRTAAPPAPPAPDFAQKSAVSTDDYDFSYSVPAEAAAYPALVTWLNADRDRARAEVARDAAEFRKESVANDFPFRKYESTTAWKRVAQTPRFLSLSGDTYVYIGGAHGSPGFRSLVWDRQHAARIDPTALFTSDAAIEAAIGAAFCDALDVQRAKRRGAPVVRDDDIFNACPKVSDATLILGSTDGKAFDRIGLLVGPYVAGAYAEGSYDLTLPVTPAVLRAVKPDYRDAFATRG